VQPCVGALQCEEFVVRAAFDDASFVQDDDAVGPSDRAEAVGDHEAGAALHQAGKGDLESGFRERVDGAGGFVEHEDARIGQQCAGEGD